MDARLAHVEARIDRIDSRLDGLDGRLRAIEQSLSGVSAKLDVLGDRVVGKLPSWWQMPAVIGSTIVLLTALWAAIRYLHDKGLL